MKYLTSASMSTQSSRHLEARSSFDDGTSEDSDLEIDQNENDGEDEGKDSDDIENNSVSGIDCTRDFCEVQLADNLWQRYRVNVPDGSDIKKCDQCTISMEVTYDGESWVSIAFSEDGEMVGSEAVIGIWGENGNIPQKYYLGGKADSQIQAMPRSRQTLTDATVEVSNGQTIMKFTKIMNEEGEIEIKAGENKFLWAYGSSATLGYHPARASYIMNLSTGSSEGSVSSDKTAWLAHGIMAFMAWGVLVPFAVQSSLFRDLLPKGPIWFHIHRGFNAISYALTVAVFAVAVGYYNKEGEDHFDDDHQKMGLAMFIMASAQVLGGLLRPHAPDPGKEQNPARYAWEIGHRVMGITLLACGFWQILEGIELFAKKFEVEENNEDKVETAYLIWVGLMSVAIAVGGTFFKFRKGNNPATNSGEVEAIEMTNEKNNVESA
ncbi:hypothetical protein HJC23_011610 [Cyclotella cryptica]|uniref:Cytochrome b561 domain-containing protein n=1 Tax=Cyclotella cryptica TaxID=29204 RepID=A0ABD3QS86_9STRA|eukprot:CCRYP_002744-RA/>CCRYP_002744-RA protein AED:0.06 eAED:0.05 QI:0/0/0/1/1/1/2/0/435